MACVPLRDGRPTAHPKAIFVQEAALIDGLHLFLCDYLLGRQRGDLLAGSVQRHVQHDREVQARQTAELDSVLSDIEERRKRLIRSLEMCTDPDPDLLQGVQLRLAELRAEQTDIEQERHAADLRVRDGTNPGLLDLVPVGRPNVDQSEDVMRRLFELIRLEIRYDGRTREAVYRCTLTAERMPAIQELIANHLLRTRALVQVATRGRDEGKLVIAAPLLLDVNTASSPRSGNLSQGTAP
jgi:hypothetical protein